MGTTVELHSGERLRLASIESGIELIGRLEPDPVHALLTWQDATSLVLALVELLDCHLREPAVGV